MDIKCPIFILGGAGFIGSHLADALVARQASVVVIDNLSSGQKAWLPKPAKFIQLDISKSARFKSILLKYQPKIIYHLAGHTQLREAISRPEQDARDNIGTTLRLVQLCLDLQTEVGYQPEQIVFASSSAIYGGCDAPPFTEQTSPQPVNPYGIAKLTSERYLEWYGHQAGVRVCCLRYANIYGPRQSAVGEAGVVAKFMTALTQHQPLTLYGQGNHVRDYLYVEDLNQAQIAVAERQLRGTYVVGTGVPTTSAELAKLCLTLAPTSSTVKTVEPTVAEQPASWLNAQRLQQEIHWKPQTTLAEGLQKTWLWYQQHAR